MKKPIKSLPDTNTIIRYLIKDDIPLYEKAKVFFDGVKNGNGSAVLLESVIAECIYVLTKIYQVPPGKAAESLINILHYKGVVNNDREELIRALITFSERNLDIVDCILFAKASAPDVRLFSFDEELNKCMSAGTGIQQK